MNKNLVIIPLLFLLILSISGYSLTKNRQLGRMSGLAEEYYDLGLIYLKTGSLGLGDSNLSSAVFRPPGYPLFIASVIKVWGGITDNTDALLEGYSLTAFTFDKSSIKIALQSFKAVYWVQAVLLSLSTVFLYLWLIRFISPGNAFIIAFLFGSNPYLIIMTGILHYEILHIFLMITSSYFLFWTIRKGNRSWPIIFPGILWGITTITRPTTLILPVFICLYLFLVYERDISKILKSSLLFVLGMAIIILPLTMRNYTLTGKVIPVNAQSGVALWAGTVTKLETDANHYRWWEIWDSYGLPVYNRVLPLSIYDTRDHSLVYIENAVTLDQEFMKIALHNITNQPSIYLSNIFHNFLSFDLDMNSVFIKSFLAIQKTYKRVDKSWFAIGNLQTFYPSTHQVRFEIYTHALTIFSALGVGLFLIMGFFRKKLSRAPHAQAAADIKRTKMVPIPRKKNAPKESDKPVPPLEQEEAPASFWLQNSYFLGAITIYLCFCTAHSITYMDLMYYYNKLPFLYLFSGYLLNEMNRFRIPFTGRGLALSTVSGILLLIYGAVLTFSIIVP